MLLLEIKKYHQCFKKVTDNAPYMYTCQPFASNIESLVAQREKKQTTQFKMKTKSNIYNITLL